MKKYTKYTPLALRHWLYRNLRQPVMRQVMYGIEQKTDDRIEHMVWVTIQEQCRTGELSIQLREDCR